MVPTKNNVIVKKIRSKVKMAPKLDKVEPKKKKGNGTQC